MAQDCGICGNFKFVCGIVGVAILAFRLYGDDDTFDIRMRWYVAFDMRWCVGDAVHLVRGDAWYVGDAGGDAFQPPPCQVPASHIHGLPRSTYLNTITKCKSKSTKVQIANTNANTEIQGGALGNAYLSSGCQLPATHNVQPRSKTYQPNDLFQSEAIRGVKKSSQCCPVSLLIVTMIVMNLKRSGGTDGHCHLLCCPH